MLKTSKTSKGARPVTQKAETEMKSASIQLTSALRKAGSKSSRAPAKIARAKAIMGRIKGLAEPFASLIKKILPAFGRPYNQGFIKSCQNIPSLRG